MNLILKPFTSGDIFAGATLLNNPNDDHAGDGRIIQFDTDLNEKGNTMAKKYYAFDRWTQV